MTNDVTEARAALLDVEHRRQRVLEEIDVPWWYWWILAAGWVGLGVLNDVAATAVSVGLTFAFSAMHGAIAPWVLSGQHRSRRLSVRRDLVDRHLPQYVFVSLVALVAVTIATALVLDADGSRHPSIIGSVFVAAIIVIGGPRLTGALGRRAADRS